MDDRLIEVLESLCPSEDYKTAVHYFSHFTRNVPLLIEQHLDGNTGGFEYVSCRYPDPIKFPGQKGILIVTDISFSEPDSDIYEESFMSFSEFLRWLRAIAHWWSGICPADAPALENIFHQRDLAYFESEVGPDFDKGATWWRKIEERKRVASETCRTLISSPHWALAAQYFAGLCDARFPAWFGVLASGGELPVMASVHVQQLPEGKWKFFMPVPSWGDWPERRVEITPHEFRMVLNGVIDGFIERRPHHADEVRKYMNQP